VPTKSGRCVSGARALFRRRGPLTYAMAAGVVVVLGATVTSTQSTSTASAEPPTCRPPEAGAPMFVSAECVDPRFNRPVIDRDEWRDTPVRHRYVNGHFEGTDARFSFYFPAPEQYQRRFFQTTHQLLTSEEASPDSIGFGVASGAYFVQTNIGGNEGIRSVDDALVLKKDPSVVGYRVNAAAAKFSRTLAAKMYGDHRPYGYLYGGSGGAYQTISSLENTTVWDGGVPFVMGAPNAIPGVFTVRIHALRVLRMRNRFPEVMDAIDPGGSGDPYAGLNEEERSALAEATRLGFPPRGWWNHATLTGGPLSLVAGYVPILDATYVDDFWTKPGYLGSDSRSAVARARIQHETTVVNVVAGPPRRIELASVPTGDLTGADVVIASGAAAGQRLALGPVAGNTIGFGFGARPVVVNRIQTGDTARIDNSWYLALQTYHRHQIPTPDMYGWNQFRGRDGKPTYPQRNVLIGPIGAFNGAGSNQTGRFNGKMIVLQTLMDIDALPWQADWYRTKAQQALGRRFDDSFRLYFIDHAQHGAPVGPAAHARTVSYQGALQQAVRDLSAWVERGVRPPAETRYKVVESQVEVPPTAAERRGIQPAVELKVNGGERAEIAVGQPVTFTATIEVPPQTGRVVAAEWDFEGSGNYPVAEQLRAVEPTVSLKVAHAFSAPGTYFPVLRATSHRDGDARTPYARVQNLARVRVIVK
jgi:hypothetical protein